ncbi:hypothetical protein [Okeania sp. SIO2B3]|nr:hypothetical protein [Okeania sp. SIO2B3]NET46572.1 hypothetical protein [Okeania sp. SIO2B3]
MAQKLDFLKLVSISPQQLDICDRIQFYLQDISLLNKKSCVGANTTQ